MICPILPGKSINNHQKSTPRNPRSLQKRGFPVDNAVSQEIAVFSLNLSKNAPRRPPPGAQLDLFWGPLGGLENLLDPLRLLDRLGRHLNPLGGSKRLQEAPWEAPRGPKSLPRGSKSSQVASKSFNMLSRAPLGPEKPMKNIEKTMKFIEKTRKINKSATCCQELSGRL